MATEKRQVRVTFLMTEDEVTAMNERMKSLGISNMSAYIRKMVLDGYILRVNIPEMKELVSLMRYTSNNVNQIAKVANMTGNVHESDLREIQAQQQKLWNGIHDLVVRTEGLK